MQRNNPFSYFATLLLVTLLSACGGGGGGGGGEAGGGDSAVIPQQAVLALTVNGNGETVGSVDAEVILPVGFALPIDVDGFLSTTTLSDRLPIDTFFDYSYTAPTDTTVGRLLISIIRAEGFTTGELVRMVRPLNAAETLPDISTFTATLTAYDLDGIELTAVTEQISINQEPVP